MKKYLIGFCMALCLFVFCSCGIRQPISVSFMERTGAGSSDITFLVEYQDEKTFDKFYSDILIKATEDNTKFKIRKELEEFLEITIPKKDIWYSLTSILYAAKGETGKEKYIVYKNTVNTTWIINSTKDTEILLKSVIGTLEDNSQGGELFINKQDVSKEFKLKVEAKKE